MEAENVRYVYQPLESLYILLVTNKQSNIVEDLETVRLLSKIVSSATYVSCILFMKFNRTEEAHQNSSSLGYLS